MVKCHAQNTELQNEMTKSIGKKYVNLIGDKYNLASKNWIDEMIVMVMTKLKGKNPMTKKMKLEKKNSKK
jgi:menaquinone-dependent protoporphyrinogen IX oxidase